MFDGSGGEWAGEISAIRLYEETRQGRIAKLGPDHPQTLQTIICLARALVSDGRAAPAVEHFDFAIGSLDARHFQDPSAARCLAVILPGYEQAKEFAKAETWRRKWLAVVKEKSGPDSPSYAAELAGLGNNLIQQTKHADAETILRECLTIRAKTEPDAWRTFNTQSLLGEAILGQKKYDEAESLLVKGYEGLKARFSQPGATVVAAKNAPTPASTPADSPPKEKLAEALERLIKLYDEWGKPAEAVKWRAEIGKLKT